MEPGAGVGGRGPWRVRPSTGGRAQLLRRASVRGQQLLTHCPRSALTPAPAHGPAKEFYSEKEAQDIVRTLVETVGFCHEQNVVHRDLKVRHDRHASPRQTQNWRCLTCHGHCTAGKHPADGERAQGHHQAGGLWVRARAGGRRRDEDCVRHAWVRASVRSRGSGCPALSHTPRSSIRDLRSEICQLRGARDSQQRPDVHAQGGHVGGGRDRLHLAMRAASVLRGKHGAKAATGS